MKISKGFVSGLLVGSILSISVVAYGAPAQIDAFKNTAIKYFFDGKEVSLGEDYDTIIYKNRAYVPARFVADNLGAKVDYNAEMETINFKSPEPKIVEKLVEVEKPVNCEDQSKNPGTYVTLPYTISEKNFDFKVKFLNDSDNNVTKIYVELTGKKDNKNNLSIDAYNAVLTTEENEYKMSDLVPTFYDTKIFTTIKDEETLDSFLAFKPVSEKEKEFRLRVAVKESGSENKTHNIDIKFKR